MAPYGTLWHFMALLNLSLVLDCFVNASFAHAVKEYLFYRKSYDIRRSDMNSSSSSSGEWFFRGDGDLEFLKTSCRIR
jgi:hypothetical protein